MKTVMTGFVQQKHSTIMYCMLCIFIAVFFSACDGGDNPADTGSIIFSVKLQGTSTIQDQTGSIKAAAIDCAASGISTIDVKIYGYAQEYLTDASFNCATHQGTISGVPAGSNIVIGITAKDSNGNKLFRGEATGITVTAGQVTYVDPIILLYMFDSFLIDIDLGWVYNSIATDKNDNVHISYTDYQYNENSETYNLYFKYATNVTGSWQTVTIDSDTIGYSSSSYNSIAIDSNGNVHISYSTENIIKYATNASGTWETVTIDSSGSYNSIAIDSNNKVHVSYSASNGLNYATNVSGPWETFFVDIIDAEYNNIAIDSQNNVYISYYVGYYDENNEDLKYATNVSGTWETFSVDRDDSGKLGKCPDIAIDSNDKVHISYYDENNEDLKYATNVSGTWEASIIDSNDYFGWGSSKSSIAIDSNNKVHVSYSASNRLNYATNVSGSWGITTVTLHPAEGGEEGSGGNGVFGGSNSIAIDSNDKVNISYDWQNEGGLYYAYTE